MLKSLSPPLTAMHAPVFPSPECFSGGVIIMGGESERVYRLYRVCQRSFSYSASSTARARPLPNPPNPNPFVWSFVASFVMFLRPPRPPGSGLWLAAVPTVNGCVVPCESPVPTTEQSGGVFLGHLFGKVVENIGNSSRDCIARFHSRQFPNE